MQVLSMLFYFLAQHSILAFFAVNIIGFILYLWKLGKRFMVLTFIFSVVNFFIGPLYNAWFLAKFGTDGIAIITSAEETSSMMNEQYIWEYSLLMKTAEGKSVETQFTTSNVAIYPIRNNILIPAEKQPFVIRYIPGFEKNIVIMSDKSDYGKRRINYDHLKVVEKEKTKYDFSPENAEFRKRYIAAMQDYINNPENRIDSANIKKFKAIIQNMRP
ncbi:hypothetical protein [Pedobacter sp. MR2016-24]|uniref:hypothetical protein n=1 Tax=Pedobacter sp. MR2016-24 TaxID=2994466 RepID=UPI002247C1FB|nr:hypothetical protein [Pedobacter sp. MR2016-24]MCX2485037.1 hypothetical protein [Pedobacter sp. MR2016-24]